MQPTCVQHLGNYSFSPARNLQNCNVTFSTDGTTACLFTRHWFECRIGPEWSTATFKWKLSNNKLLERLLCTTNITSQWFISNVHLVEASNSTKHNRYALCVLLLSQSNPDFSLLCYFRDIQKNCCHTIVSLQGVVSTIEWIHASAFDRDHVVAKSQLAPSMLSDTMDMSASDTKGKVTLDPVTNSFSGCLAVGFRQGYVGLLDLCLDWSTEQYEASELGSSIFVEKSQLLHDVSKGYRVSSDSQTHQHSLVYFDDSAVRWDDFQYKTENGKLLLSFPTGSVHVSAMRYIPNSQTLVVGFSFGGWQLWSLRTMRLEFSLRHMTITSPVTSITFQEPSDDPRFCCYLWIGWKEQLTDRTLESSTSGPVSENAQAKLYQLFYSSRQEEPNNECTNSIYRYQKLLGLSERLSTSLFACDASPITDQLLSIQAARQPQCLSRHPCATHLVALIWRVSADVIRIGLFDLDRWYHAQMPTHIRSDNSFFAVFDASVPATCGAALNGRLMAHSLIPFWNRLTSRANRLAALCKVDPNKENTRTPCHDSSSSSNLTSANPVPEVCLRPSALAFNFVLAWINPNQSGGFSLARFVSRQEACLLSLKRWLTSTRNTGGTSDVRFEITEWLSEAWVTGLLEAPGLDPLDEDDLERLLHISQQLTDHPRKRLIDDSEAERVGFQQAFGDSMDPSLMGELEELLPQSTDGNRPAKRVKADQQSEMGFASLEGNHATSQNILSPSWVILLNCLLEHGHLSILKSIERLATGSGPHSPANPRFRIIWLWLRFRRLKNRFDRLAAPLLDGGSDSRANDSDASIRHATIDTHDLGSVTHQLLQISVLAPCWISGNCTPSSSPSLGNSALNAIETFARYARLVTLFCRLGVVPRKPVALTDTTNHNALLVPYDPELLHRVITKMASAPPSDESDDDEADSWLPSPIGDALLKAAVADDTRVWVEQEQLSSREPPSYPPTRIRSLCALFQLPSSRILNKTRLAMLAYFLCDLTAATAFFIPTTAETNSKIQALNSEAISPTLRSFLTNTDHHAPFRRDCIINLFSGQMDLLSHYLKAHQQWDVLGYLKKLAYQNPTDSSDYGESGQKFHATGAPYLALSRLRRQLYKFRGLHRHQEASQMGFDALVKLAEICRRAGRLGDLINFGLSQSESQLLFAHYKKSKDSGIPFHCLLAKKQYKAALKLGSDHQQQQQPYQNVETTNFSSSSTSSNLSVIAQLLKKSLPNFHEDETDHSGASDRMNDDSDERSSSSSSSSTSSSPPASRQNRRVGMAGIAYLQDSAIACPVTDARVNPRLSRKREFAHTPDQTPPPPNTLRGRLVRDNLLATAKKGCSEFWETFHELERVDPSFNWKSSWLSYSTCNTSLFSAPDRTITVSKKPAKDQSTLFKSIYTPPPSRDRTWRNATSFASKTKSTKMSCSYNDVYTPLSILKPSVPKPITENTDTSFSSCDTRSLNATLDDDAEVTLNLSTIRPSSEWASTEREGSVTLSATPIVISSTRNTKASNPKPLDEPPMFDFDTSGEKSRQPHPVQSFSKSILVHPTEEEDGDFSMDLDDNMSIISSTADSSFSSDTPRRSGRRIRLPNRYDPSRL